MESNRRESADGSSRVRGCEARAQGKDAELISQGFEPHFSFYCGRLTFRLGSAFVVNSMCSQLFRSASDPRGHRVAGILDRVRNAVLESLP